MLIKSALVTICTLASGACLVPSTPALAKTILATPAGINAPVTIRVSHSPKTYRGKVTNSATIPLQTQTVVASYADIDESTCTELAVGTFTTPKRNPDKRGSWQAGTITGKLSDGECPSTTFTFAAMAYTWTDAKSKSGRTDMGIAHYSFSYGGDTYDYRDAITVTLK